MTEPVLVGILLGVLSLASLVHLWLFQSERILRKLAWTPVVIVPLFGPLFYFSLFQPLSGQSDLFQARESDELAGPTHGDAD